MPGPRPGKPWIWNGKKVKLIRVAPPMIGDLSNSLVFISYEGSYSMAMTCTKNMMKDPDLFRSLYQANIQEFLKDD